MEDQEKVFVGLLDLVNIFDLVLLRVDHDFETVFVVQEGAYSEMAGVVVQAAQMATC